MKNAIKILKILPVLALLQLRSAWAHCPLCTAGAAAAAGGALWLGIDKSVVGLFLGAFAVSTGWWVSRLIKKEYVPYQKPLFIVSSFLLTILPLYPLITQVYPVYISWAGGYGSLLNRTYVLNPPLYASLLGGIIVSSTPWISAKIGSLRQGKMIPFQGMVLTFGVLFIAGIIIQVVI